MQVLRRLIKSVIDQVERILIVDNGSANISEVGNEIEHEKKIDLIALGENFGIAKAHNAGIERANEMGASHVLIFDHDSLAPSSLVDTLLQAEKDLLNRGEKIAAIGPSFFDPRTGNRYPISRIEGFSLKNIYPNPAAQNTYIEASFLISSGSLIRLSALYDVGLMREDFFIDYVDIEWCLRAASRGYKCFAVPSTCMEHSVGDKRLRVFGREISIHSPLRRYYLARNSILMMKLKYVPWKYKARELFYSLSRVIVFLCFVSNKIKYLKYISIGWAHGIAGRGGKFNA